MREIITFEKPARVICHLLQDERRAEATMSRLVVFQTLIDCSRNFISPSGDYIRLNSSTESELNGWFLIEDVIIDEILQEMDLVGDNGQWIDVFFNEEIIEEEDEAA